MKVNIGNFEFTEVWDGVLYKKLSDYPHISNWELKTIIDFINYEKLYNRNCTIECDNADILNKINSALENPKAFDNLKPPAKITECTACPKRKGCMTEFVCHTSPIENALSIFKSGKLLSAVNARNLPASILKAENRNAANDPEDYFEYIMFAWGNCQAGDRLVMERKLKRFPNDEDLSINFTPGVRFYFKYDTIIKHPNAVFEGVLPLKIKDEVKLEDWVYAIIIPEKERDTLKNKIPDTLANKVYYIKNDCKDIWDWSEKVYSFIENL